MRGVWVEKTLNEVHFSGMVYVDLDYEPLTWVEGGNYWLSIGLATQLEMNGLSSFGYLFADEAEYICSKEVQEDFFTTTTNNTSKEGTI